MTARSLAALSLVPLLALAGCGAEETSAPAEPPTSLTITVWADGRGEGKPVERTVECTPAASDPGCVRLAALGPDAFAPVPGDAVCTEIYGGPQEARVAGTVDGTPVEATLTRANGCEIARWDAVAAVVPLPVRDVTPSG